MFHGKFIGLIGGLVLALALMPGSALAAPSGATGPITAPRPNCNVGNGFRDLYAPVPTIYAANRTAGAGNDRQAVHYWVRAYDYSTGTVVTNWVYGGSSWANDNVAGVFPAQGSFAGQRYLAKWRFAGAVVRLQYSVAWYSPGGTLLGTNDPSATSYQLWAFGTNQQIGISYAC